jgi:hypothetical protein
LEAEPSAVGDGLEHAGGADVAAGRDRAGVQRGRGAGLDPGHQGRVPHLNLQHPRVVELVQTDGDRLAVPFDGNDPFHGSEPAVDLALEQERRRVDVVVAGVGVAPVVAVEAGVAAQHQAVGVGVVPVGPRHRGHRVDLQLGAGEVPDHGLAGEVAPQRLGLAVVHDQRRVVEHPRRAELEHPVAEPAVVGDRRVAQRAVRDRRRDACEGVVDDLVPDQHLHRIRPGLAGDREGENRLVVGQEPHLVGAQELGLVDRRDPVRGGPPDTSAAGSILGSGKLS